MLKQETLFESLDLLAITHALQENSSTALLWVDTAEGRPLVFAISPWLGNLKPIQAQHLRELTADECVLMVWSERESRVEIVHITVFPEGQ